MGVKSNVNNKVSADFQSHSIILELSTELGFPFCTQFKYNRSIMFKFCTRHVRIPEKTHENFIYDVR